MTLAEHKLNIVHQIDDLSEESLIELEKIIAKLKAKQTVEVLPKKRRQPPKFIAGKAKILGDLIEPCFDTRESNDMMLEEQVIHLKAEDMAFFLQVLENPPKANQALKEAAKCHKRLINHA
jgi:hypothetical protein